jgi:hypothetical protein
MNSDRTLFLDTVIDERFDEETAFLAVLAHLLAG